MTEIQSLNDIVGQARAKRILHLLAIAEKRTGRIPNLGVWGRSGMGKTALVTAWCDHHDYQLRYLNGPAVRDIMPLRQYFRDARENPNQKFLVFVDESHGMSKRAQTALLSILEKPYVLTCEAPKDIGRVVTPEGLTAYISKGDILREAVPNNLSFALASTNRERMIHAVMNRLRHIEIEDYSEDELVEIVEPHLDPQYRDQDVMVGLVRRSRSVRQLLEEILGTFKDIYTAYGSADLELLDEILAIDNDGATETDKAYLHYVNRVGKAGLENIAAFFQKDKDEVRSIIEPFLFSKGWVITAGTGRQLTKSGRAKIGAYEPQ